jgi:hypothetical protein
MHIGICRLWWKRASLVDSHVWPAWIYRRYAADLSRGGRFIDLQEMRFTNDQTVENWLCAECDNVRLGITENYAARLCAAFEEHRTTPRAYDHRLLHFATYISWRGVLFYAQHRPERMGPTLRRAAKRWKEYLLGRRKDVRPFSQHLWVVFDPKVGLHRGLRATLDDDEGVLVSQIGPLWVVARLGRGQRSLADLKVWEVSELRPGGGTIAPVSEWRTGKNVTLSFALLMCERERETVQAGLRMGERMKGKVAGP